MQPKIWLACVLACIGLLLAVFCSLPPIESEEAPAATFAAPASAEAAEIVAPPAEPSMSPDPRAYDLRSSSGAAPPYFGEASEAAAGHGGEDVRVAAEARLGPGGVRVDNQAPAEPGGATIYEVAPLARPDSGPHEGRTFR